MFHLGEDSETRKLFWKMKICGRNNRFYNWSCDQCHVRWEAQAAKSLLSFLSHSHQSKELDPRGSGSEDHPTRNVHEIQTYCLTLAKLVQFLGSPNTHHLTLFSVRAQGEKWWVKGCEFRNGWMVRTGLKRMLVTWATEVPALFGNRDPI